MQEKLFWKIVKINTHFDQNFFFKFVLFFFLTSASQTYASSKHLETSKYSANSIS